MDTEADLGSHVRTDASSISSKVGAGIKSIISLEPDVNEQELMDFTSAYDLVPS
jgi:hypothetical protein